jgi:drug/metabolite transporter (DMT)-like permease
MKAKTLLACGVIAGPLFVLVFLVEGATRAYYDPLRHPVSSLAFGGSGWTQRANFLVAGLLMLAFAIGLRRALRPLEGSTWGPLLVGACAIGLLGAGFFVADPRSGYPPGAPDKRLDFTTHGVLHDLFSTLVLLALPAACFVFGRWFATRKKRGWAIYSVVSGVVFLGVFVLANAGFKQAEGLVAVAGLFQRVALIVGFGWLTLLAVHFLGSPP